MLTRSLGIALVLGSALYGQQPPHGLAFEVASIKAAPPPTAAMFAAGKFHIGMKVDQAQVSIGYSSLADLIRMAYEVKPYQISGPDWIADQKWNILATIPDGAPPSRVPQMLQVLLAERFGLTVHRESQGRRVYGLEVANGGPKLKPSPAAEVPISEPGPGGNQAEEKPLVVVTRRDSNSTVSSGAGFGITRAQMQPDGSMHFESSKMTPAQLADALSFYLDLPVVDLTQLPGSYLVELEFSGADLRFAAMKAGAAPYSQPDLATESVGASLITSVQKLGLRLKPQQAPIEMIVVDRLGKAPTAN